MLRKRPISVVVSDGMPLFRRGAAAALHQHAEVKVVAEAADGEAAMKAILRTGPEVAVLDLDLPGLTGAEFMLRLARNGKETKIVLISAMTDPHVIWQSLASGVSGYLTKQADERQIGTAVVAAASGGTFITDELQAILIGAIDGQTNGRPPGLSVREREVLELVSLGRSASQIGAMLHLSETSIKTYLRRAYVKLDVANAPAAVGAALRRGLIE